MHNFLHWTQSRKTCFTILFAFYKLFGLFVWDLFLHLFTHKLSRTLFLDVYISFYWSFYPRNNQRSKNYFEFSRSNSRSKVQIPMDSTFFLLISNLNRIFPHKICFWWAFWLYSNLCHLGLERGKFKIGGCFRDLDVSCV